MFGKTWKISLVACALGLCLAVQAAEDVPAKKVKMSKKEQRAFQDGNLLLREYKYYEAAEALPRPGRRARPRSTTS